MKALATFALALTALSLHAQSPQPASGETVNVTVAEVDVVVLDAKGQPVRGLTRDDFELTAGGRARPITNFYAGERAETTNGRPAPVPSVAATPTAAADVQRPSRVVFYFDDAHIHQGSRKRALDQLRRFARERLNGHTAAMIVVADERMRIAQPFTSDAAAIERAIDGIEGQPAHALTRYESERRELIRSVNDTFGTPAADHDLTWQNFLAFADRERSRTEVTIASLEAALHVAEALDGRRTLVYVSEGLPLRPAEETLHAFKEEVTQFKRVDEIRNDLSQRFYDLAKRCAASGVEFFALNPSGLRGSELTPEDQVPMDIDAMMQRENLRAPLQLLADETGGRLIENQNDLGIAFDVLYDHLTTFYSLGFRSDGDGRNEEIRVRVKKPGFTVRATRHLHERTPREELEARVRGNLYLRREENPLDAKVGVAPAPPGPQPGVRAIVRVPMSRLAVMPEDTGKTGVAVFVMLLDAEMNESPMRLVHHQFSESDVSEAVQRLAITTRPGKYVVSVAVADRYTGEASYFVRDVTVE
jgi:VWFA-related protein